MIAYDLTSTDLETFCRALGLLGFAIYVTGFFCLSLGKLNSTGPLYFSMVLVASSCVLASLWADFNLSAALIQGFYIAMSLGAIVLRLRRWHHAAPSHRPNQPTPQPPHRSPAPGEAAPALDRLTIVLNE